MSRKHQRTIASVESNPKKAKMPSDAPVRLDTILEGGECERAQPSHQPSHRLYDHALHSVFAFLRFEELVLVARACTAWHAAACQPQALRTRPAKGIRVRDLQAFGVSRLARHIDTVVLVEAGHKSKLRALRALTTVRSLETSVRIHANPDHIRDGVWELPPNLTHLKLRICMEDDDTAVPDMTALLRTAFQLARIVTLDITIVCRMQHMVPVSLFPVGVFPTSLTTFRLAGDVHLSRLGLAAIACIPSPTHVDVENGRLSTEEIELFLASACTNGPSSIQWINLQNTRLNAETTMQLLAHACPNLTILEPASIAPECIPALSDFPHLTRVFVEVPTAQDEIALTEIFDNMTLPCLEQLALRTSRDIMRLIVQTLAPQRYPSLVSFLTCTAGKFGTTHVRVDSPPMPNAPSFHSILIQFAETFLPWKAPPGFVITYNAWTNVFYPYKHQ